MTVNSFEELQIWKDARSLVKEVYILTSGVRFSKDYNLRGQIRSAAVSVMSNIAEGFERGGNQEFAQFLYIAKGSCGEVRSQLYVAIDQGYLPANEAEQTVNAVKRLSSMIASLIQYLKNSGMKGAKYTDSNQRSSAKIMTTSESLRTAKLGTDR